MIKLFKEFDEKLLPKYQTKFSVGADLKAAESVEISPGCTRIVPTGITIDMPSFMEAQIRSRSGLSTKGIVVANSPGTIDPDYKGEIKVILYNRGNVAYTVKKYDRIAQMVFNSVIRLTDEIEVIEKERGDHGLGST